MNERSSVHELLAKKPALLGMLQMYPSPVVAELAALCGYDFIVLDCEHGILSDLDILHTVQTSASTELAVLVRPSGLEGQAFGRFLDLGVDGFVAPNVSTPEQAAAIVQAMVYPPHGTRGFGAAAHRTSRYGFDLAAHKASPRGKAFLTVLIESALGVANVDAILAVDGVDAAMIGPADLSADLGAVGDFSKPEFGLAFTSLEGAAAAHGKIAGAAPHAGQQLRALMERGHRMFMIGADVGLVREAMTAQLEKAKDALGLKPS